MAEEKRSRSEGVPTHPLVEALASDPNQPPKQATKLFGFPGPAAERKSTRLWLDEDLTAYVDVPNEAILFHRTLDNELGTALWVDPEATLTYSVPRDEEVQADYLGGAIAQQNMTLTRAGILKSLPNDTTLRFGPSIAIVCPSRGIYCPSDPICEPFESRFCVSRLYPCPSPNVICMDLTVESNPVCRPEPVWPVESPIINQIGTFRANR
jgi:hypothetical protein